MRSIILHNPRIKFYTRKIHFIYNKDGATGEKPTQQQKKDHAKVEIRVRPKRLRHQDAAQEISTQNKAESKTQEKQNVPARSEDQTAKEKPTQPNAKERKKLERRARRKYLRKARRRPKDSKDEQKKSRRRRRRRHRQRRRRHRRHSVIRHVLCISCLSF